MRKPACCLLLFFVASVGLFYVGRWCLSSGCFNKEGEAPIVASPAGKVKGAQIKSRNGRDIYAYRGVWFAFSD